MAIQHSHCRPTLSRAFARDPTSAAEGKRDRWIEIAIDVEREGGALYREEDGQPDGRGVVGPALGGRIDGGEREARHREVYRKAMEAIQQRQ